MRLMGEQFVTGETIDEALANAATREAEGFRYSYDMLGEAALTAARRRALPAPPTSRRSTPSAGRRPGRGIYDGPGHLGQALGAAPALQPRAAASACWPSCSRGCSAWRCWRGSYDIGLNIDAEEADRLELSLDLLERLCFEPGLAGWNGIGFVVQAYQKRCPFVIDWLIDLARRSGHRLMVRLVKGAYWDSEIKRAQVDGLDGYPVYTRKVYTDVSYLACARKLLAAPDAVYPAVRHPQRADAGRDPHAGRAATTTPGSTSSSACTAWASRCTSRWSAREGKLGRPCRIYAPVGTHETLLAYLVRRLLENGANTSFVNRIADDSLSARRAGGRSGATVRQLAEREGALGAPHPAIALPRDLYGAGARELARRSTSPTSTRWPRWRGAGRRRGAARGAPRRCSAHRRCRIGRGAPVRNPADRRRRRRPGARGRRRRRRGRAAPRRRPRPRPGPPRAPAAARRVRWSAPPTQLEADIDRADRRCSCARPARPRPTRSPRCARRSTSCATTRRRCGATSTTPRTGRWARSSASARGTSRWRSSPARSRRRWPPATRCSPSRPSRRR